MIFEFNLFLVDISWNVNYKMCYLYYIYSIRDFVDYILISVSIFCISEIVK